MSTSSVDALDRGLYALFSRHADSARHDRDRTHYRGAALRTDFDLYLARVYGLSWLAFGLGVITATSLALAVPASLFSVVIEFLHQGLPLLNRLVMPQISRLYAAVAFGVGIGFGYKRAVVWSGQQYLKWTAAAGGRISSAPSPGRFGISARLRREATISGCSFER